MVRIQFILILFLLAEISTGQTICGDFYKKNSSYLVFPEMTLSSMAGRSLLVTHTDFSETSRESQEVTFKIDPNHHGDLQIEVQGTAHIRYLISSLKLNNEITLVGPDSKNKSPQIDDRLLSLVDDFPGLSDVAAYNSQLRSIPGNGFVSLVIPYRLLKKHKNSYLLTVKVEKDSVSRETVKVRLIQRKNLKSSAAGRVDLNIFIPENMSAVFSESNQAELLYRLNRIYESAGIYFKIDSLSYIKNEFNHLQLETLPESLDHKMVQSKPALSLVFCSSISSCALGSIAGFSQGIPGPSSLEGSQRQRVYVTLQQPPQKIDTLAFEAWLIESGNLLAHEIGHYLGLTHTYERSSNKLQDPFSDTPNVDSNNVMDPLVNRLGIPIFSFKQIDQLRAHPIISP